MRTYEPDQLRQLQNHTLFLQSLKHVAERRCSVRIPVFGREGGVVVERDQTPFVG